jgi:hypothetical protein
MDLRPRDTKPEKPKGLRANKTSFKKDNPGGPGRGPGTPNKTTALLKECILQAAEIHGQDGKGKGGLIGFLLNIAEKDLRAYAMLLSRVMPLQVDHRKEVKVEVTYRSVEEIQEELAQRGIRLDLLARALYTKPKLLIDNEGKDVNTDRTK